MSTELSSKILEIPAFGRHFSLGTLYNALADQVIPGYTFWSENDLRNVKTTRNDNTKFSFISSDRLSEKLSDLNVNGSLQISILAGLIDLKGSASYLHKKKSTCRESSVHVRFKYMTAVKSLTMDQLDESKIRYPEIAKNGKIGKATHVVTQIQYGAEATFTFTKRFESDDEEEKASGELKINVGKLLKLLNVDAEVGGSVREKNKDSASNIDCQFEGDFKLPDNVKGPTTFEEALEFAKIFVEVSSDSMAKDINDGKPLGVPCTVWLFPLALMQDAEGAPAIRYEVSLSIASECVQLIEDYDNLEAKLNLMLNDSMIKQISPLYKKLRLFHQYLTSFRGELKTKLGKLIIDIRSGKVDVGHFRHLLDHITGKKFPLNPNGISDCWLDQKYKEFCMINRFKEQARQGIHKLSQEEDGNKDKDRDKIIFFPSARTLQNTRYSVDFCVEITFPWLGRAEPFLEIVRNQTPNSGVISENPKTMDNNAIEKDWCEDSRLFKRIQKEINVFAKLVNEKANDKKFAFIFTTPDDDENTTYASESSIIVHHQLTRNCGWNALQIICQYYPRDNLNDVVLLLLDDTTDIDKYRYKFNCLFILCRFYQKENLLEFVQVFLDRKIDINCKDDDGWTPLLILCRYYDKDNLIDIVRLFLNEKFDLEINWRNNEGFNALHILCGHYTKKNLIDIIKLFIQRKIDLNCKTNIGWNALNFVCRFQSKNNLPDLVRLLIQNKEVLTTGGEGSKSYEYKEVEQKLAEAYEKSFENIKIKMRKFIEEKNLFLCSTWTTSMRDQDGQIQGSNENSSDSFEFFRSLLRDEIVPVKQKLDKEVDDMVKKEGREKWSRQIEETWKNKKKDQALNWECNLLNTYNLLFHYEYHVEKYKKKMRTKINKLFKSSTNSWTWTEDTKNKKFEEMFRSILTEAENEFPPKDVRKEITKVYQESIVIKKRLIKINWDVEPTETNQSKKEEDKKSDWISNLVVQLINEITNWPNWFKKSKSKEEKEKEISNCAASVYDTVHRIAARKPCYDDSIISNVIREVDSTIIAHNFTEHTVFERMHNNVMRLIFNLMEKTQKEWEKQNSVPAKLESNEAILRNYFMMVSQGRGKSCACGVWRVAGKSCVSPCISSAPPRRRRGLRPIPHDIPPADDIGKSGNSCGRDRVAVF